MRQTVDDMLKSSVQHFRTCPSVAGSVTYFQETGKAAKKMIVHELYVRFALEDAKKVR